MSIDENVVTITEEGTYILSGSLSDGMVIVDSRIQIKFSLFWMMYLFLILSRLLCIYGLQIKYLSLLQRNGK